MARLQRDGALCWFASRYALLGRFQTVIDRVAQQVVERAFDFGEDVAVHQRVLAVDDQAHFFTQAARQIAHHARKGVHTVAKWPHPQRQHLVQHLLRNAQQAPLIGLQLRQPIAHSGLERCGLFVDGVQLFLDGLWHTLGAHGIAQLLQCSKYLVLLFFKPLQGFQMRLQRVRRHPRLAGQREQMVKVARIDF